MIDRERILEIVSILQDLAQELKYAVENMNGTEKKYYTISEVSRLLGVHSMTVWRKARNGEIPAVRVGKKYLIPASYLMRKAS